MSSDDEDMDSGSESEYSYHSESDEDEGYSASGHGGGEGKRNRAASSNEPYTVLSKHDLNKHKSEVRHCFVFRRREGWGGGGLAVPMF